MADGTEHGFKREIEVMDRTNEAAERKEELLEALRWYERLRICQFRLKDLTVETVRRHVTVLVGSRMVEDQPEAGKFYRGLCPGCGASLIFRRCK